MPPESCVATTAKGQPCRARPVHGSDRCIAHLGPRRSTTKLNDETAGQIVKLLRSGAYIEVACAAAGVSRRTYHDWWKRGHPDGSERRDADCRRFRAQAEQALAESEAVSVAVIATAARTSWQAAAWMLERRHPERWARLSQREKEETPAPAPAGLADPFAEVDELAARRKQPGA